MSWDRVNAHNGRTRIGVQSSLGTAAGTMVDLVINSPELPLGKLTRKMIPRRDQRRYRRDNLAPVKGLKAGAPVEMTVDCKRVATRLAAGASPQAYDDSAPLSHQILLRAGLGAELDPQPGSAATGTPSTTSVAVTSSTGTRFALGQIVIVNGAPRRVTGISGDTLTLYPALANAPSATDAILNAYNYFPGENDTLALTVEHAPTESGTPELQQRALGVHGGLEITLTVGDVVRYAYKGTALDWTEPGNLSIALDTVADDMGAPMVWDPVIYLQSAGTAPSVVQITEMKVSVPRKWREIPGPGTQGVSAIAEVASHDMPIMIEIAGHMGTAQWAAFAAQTERWLMAYTQDGSGTDQRTVGLYAPRVVFAEPPNSEVSDGLVFFRGKLLPLFATDIDSTPTPGSTPETAVAPLLWFLG